MRVTILGSGTNIHPTRAAAGYLVRTDHTILLDFGPRTLANLLKTGVNRHRITHILFSHYHADHFSDFITYFFDAMIFTKYQGGTTTAAHGDRALRDEEILPDPLRYLTRLHPRTVRGSFQGRSRSGIYDWRHESDSPNCDPYAEPPLPGVSNRIWREGSGLFRRFSILRQPRAALWRR